MDLSKTITSRTGSDSLTITANTSSHYVRLHHRHTDDFDADGDRWVTLGEFSVAEITAALGAPVAAVQHVAETPPPPARRRRWRRK
jgi:hypothetical protein